jgi:hypothetical protein
LRPLAKLPLGGRHDLLRAAARGLVEYEQLGGDVGVDEDGPTGAVTSARPHVRSPGDGRT